MKKIALSILLFVSLLFTVFILTGCGDENKEPTIVGSWKNTYLGYDFIYTFNDDGTGKYDAGGTIMEFTYTTDGNNIAILYTGDTDPFRTIYSLDGNVLNVKDSAGKDTFYDRIK